MAAQYSRCARASDSFAGPLVQASGIAHSPLHPLVVFDNACGTGVIGSTLYGTLPREKTRSWELLCGDMSPHMLAYTDQRVKDEGWTNVETRIIDAQDTKLPSGRYTHVFAAFAFNLFSDPQAGLREALRVLQPKGTLAISVWKEGNWFPITRAAIATLPGNLPYPSQTELNSIYNSGWDDPTRIAEFLAEAGFTDIDVTTGDKKIAMSLDDLAEACLMVNPIILGRFWTQEQRDQYAHLVPGAVKRYIEGLFGKEGTGYLEATAIIAVARKG
ncbi:S-adenosyl-L-methionine-dependent methyltransferase [Aspergillus pseudodeflectus]|uniref:S-adenosyl-L-methionine-dependent methyltransferase n=1 Tax=Aspergillus pseudodeflectus TaxID=176178 RepID=A0ABR4L508_9EURO